MRSIIYLFMFLFFLSSCRQIFEPEIKKDESSTNKPVIEEDLVSSESEQDTLTESEENLSDSDINYIDENEFDKTADIDTYTPECGNSILDSQETCELNASTSCTIIDENYISGTASCKNDCSGWDESKCLTNLCGDDTVTGAEKCEKGAFKNCVDLDASFSGGIAICSKDCLSWNTETCSIPTCGDGKINGEEICELDNQTACSTLDPSYIEGIATCKDDCSGWDLNSCKTPYCGDNILGEGEICESGDAKLCQEVSTEFAGGMATCNATCDGYDKSNCIEHACGDNIRGNNEVCEIDTIKECRLVSPDFTAGVATCKNDCSGWDTTACISTSCGDNIVNGGEVCEQNHMILCSSWSSVYTSGAAICKNDCSGYDISDCSIEISPQPYGYISVDFISTNVINIDEINRNDRAWHNKVNLYTLLNSSAKNKTIAVSGNYGGSIPIPAANAKVDEGTSHVAWHDQTNNTIIASQESYIDGGDPTDPKVIFTFSNPMTITTGNVHLNTAPDSAAKVTLYNISDENNICAFAVGDGKNLNISVAENLTDTDGGKISFTGTDIPIYHPTNTPDGNVSAHINEPICAFEFQGDAFCGNKIVEAGETCDQEVVMCNTISGYENYTGMALCNNDCNGYDVSGCRIELCGNSVVDAGEVCEQDTACKTIDPDQFTGGTATCVGCYRYDFSECTINSCGNRIRENEEICDGSIKTCVEIDAALFASGTAHCNNSCSGYDTSTCEAKTCGNGTIDESETCDGNSIDCTTLDDHNFIGGTAICSSSCMSYDTSGCKVPLCGNRVINEGEVCDSNTVNCIELSSDFIGGTATCKNDCSDFDTSSCQEQTCGNGVADDGETCDPNASNATSSCSEIDPYIYSGGSASCKSDCSGYALTNCETFTGQNVGTISQISVNTDFIFDGSKKNNMLYMFNHIDDIQKPDPGFVGEAASYVFPETDDGKETWTSTVYDQFGWDGSTGSVHRLVVVQANVKNNASSGTGVELYFPSTTIDEKAYHVSWRESDSDEAKIIIVKGTRKNGDICVLAVGAASYITVTKAPTNATPDASGEAGSLEISGSNIQLFDPENMPYETSDISEKLLIYGLTPCN